MSIPKSLHFKVAGILSTTVVCRRNWATAKNRSAPSFWEVARASYFPQSKRVKLFRGKSLCRATTKLVDWTIKIGWKYAGENYAITLNEQLWIYHYKLTDQLFQRCDLGGSFQLFTDMFIVSFRLESQWFHRNWSQCCPKSEGATVGFMVLH